MKVSIITPSYNSGTFLEKCILNVKNQNYQNIELIIVDGGSTDNTLNILKKFDEPGKVLWVSEKDKGIAHAMDKGFRMASGDIFAWLDADNYYSDGIVREVVSIFESNPDIEVVYGNIEVVDGNGKLIRVYNPPKVLTFKKALIETTGAIPPQPAVFFRRQIFERVGGFDTNFKVAGDVEFWIKVLQTNPKIYYLNKIFGYYYSDGTTASQSIKGVIKGYKEMLFIGKKYGQSTFGKVVMFFKYLKGYIGSLRSYLKK